MANKTLLIVLGALVFVTFLAIKILKGKTKVFVKKTNYYLLFTALIFAALGLTGWFVREIPKMQAPVLCAVLFAAFLALGWLHERLFFKVLPWPREGGALLETLFNFLLLAWAGLYFITVFTLLEKPATDGMANYAGWMALGLLFFPVPLLVRKMYSRWEAIPDKEIKAWDLPIGTTPITILPGNLMRITVWVTVKFQDEMIEKFDFLAPKDRTLGEIFYYLLYRHNFDPSKRFKKLEISENNQKDKVYRWLFFKEVKKWWWMSKKYFNPETPIGKLDIQKGDVIIAGRVKDW